MDVEPDTSPTSGPGAPDDSRAWRGSSAELEWASSFDVHRWDRCASHDYIRVLPHLMDAWPPSPRLMAHFDEQLGSLRIVPLAVDPDGVARSPRRLAVVRPRRRVDGAAAVVPHRGAEGQVSPGTWGDLSSLCASLRGGAAPPYDPQLAASLAYWIGIHPVYVWPEALLSHEMFLAFGWIGLLRRRGGAWMPAAVGDYLADVLQVDTAGRHLVAEPMLAAILPDQAVRGILAEAVERRSRRDEAFVRWPSRGGAPSTVEP